MKGTLGPSALSLLLPVNCMVFKTKHFFKSDTQILNSRPDAQSRDL